jgi:hypothetical protein
VDWLAETSSSLALALEFVAGSLFSGGIASEAALVLVASSPSDSAPASVTASRGSSGTVPGKIVGPIVNARGTLDPGAVKVTFCMGRNMARGSDTSSTTWTRKVPGGKEPVWVLLDAAIDAIVASASSGRVVVEPGSAATLAGGAAGSGTGKGAPPRAGVSAAAEVGSVASVATAIASASPLSFFGARRLMIECWKCRQGHPIADSRYPICDAFVYINASDTCCRRRNFVT